MPYFDSASAAPLHPVARQALQASLDEGWADPARLYREGRRARLLLDAAREAAAEAVGCRADELVFTPSGTHAVHTGIAGVLAGRRRVGDHLVVSAVEHSSVLHSAAAHEARGGSVSEVPVDRSGAVSAAGYADALVPATALACLQSANHEVGTVQPVAEVAEVCGAAGVPLLVDAAQSLAWGPVEAAWSVLAASAHKWGGPPGVGLLAVRKGVRFSPQGPADERESGRSPGFTNLPAIVAAAASLRAVRAEADAEAARLRVLVDRIRRRVVRLVPDVEVVGDADRRLPHLVTFSCLYVDGEALLHELDRAGFSVSSGSSCTSSTLTPSHVLRAMGVLSEGNVRVSLPPGTPAEEVNAFLEVLPGAVAGVRERLGVTEPPAAVPEADSLELDALGLRCPQPVIELARAIARVPVGGTVTVLSDDEVARLDIPAWCAMRGHDYLGESPRPTGTAYTVRRQS
ncbi:MULTISPECIES: cysteine desulfurase/sulfurtransferase TusA family protein [Streptomyces]|uniref:Aminotransferase n=1 Tax=Streptomyces virginiae TaxID=1961 RepID=A0ABQ3NZ97_STRVG|nr:MULTISPECIES: cysteine desulfurase/sulfurtransferase TusA family protein [Streptomyces]KOV13879.1 cysteine desulfurase [Streptomyces sp. XY511]MBP2343715.1 cysteine desulfurase [Streptomyces virginiae]MCI4081118.1 cysteine desulfurase/sulfurtransferase TusA family protein [Streptomyces sp. MMS21 TC-5]QNE27688.1 aminotransferase class V-fold PLP-dependent enzyme [Streptomyces sp. INR7]GGP88083.1 aminotransferase [Streptomyces virginiae]